MIVGELDRKPGRGIEIYRLLQSSRPGIAPEARITPSIGEVKLEFKNEVPLRLEAQFDLLPEGPFNVPVSLIIKGSYIPWNGEILMAGGKP
ncbi:hypothetical protein EDD52_12259 [Primorskyibacter sedentarius]|uniref:Uncharacterized protein n=2 Tax=Primorskyibacter sedentarius TaxID=745311 RepID=A0A4R3J397_9RHOB|nr:hypothetical protein EDD52_12259 [Primorskyibacter sedentarius]